MAIWGQILLKKKKKRAGLVCSLSADVLSIHSSAHYLLIHPFSPCLWSIQSIPLLPFPCTVVHVCVHTHTTHTHIHTPHTHTPHVCTHTPTHTPLRRDALITGSDCCLFPASFLLRWKNCPPSFPKPAFPPAFLGFNVPLLLALFKKFFIGG